MTAQLTPSQRDFVDAPAAPLLAIAGAGTGKTTALVARVERFLRAGAEPAGVAVFTFTIRAAGELVQRLEAARVPGAGRVVAGTFHAEAARAIRRHPRAAGIDPEFSILDREHAEALMERAIASSLGRSGFELMTARRALDLLGQCVRAQTWPAQLLENQPSLIEPVNAVFARYAQDKRAASVADFDDLLVGWRAVIDAHPAYPESIQHVLVDEYQDVNLLQAELIDRLAAPSGSLTVVGDDSQAIYSFRGGDLAPMRTFRARHPDATVVVLTENHRCRPSIVRVANESIAFNHDRFPKNLIATRPVGRLPVVAMCASAREEAEFVASRCRELVDGGRTSIGILHRANWHARHLIEALSAHDLPIAPSSSGMFFRASHIQDALCVLRLLHHPQDAAVLRKVLGLLEGVGPTSIRRVLQEERRGPLVTRLVRGLSSRRVQGKARASLEAFTAAVSRVTLPASREPASVLETLVGWDCLAHRFHAKEAARDLDALIGIAGSAQTLGEFFDRLALLRAHGEMPGAGEGLVVSTVHRAKGLEWDTVFVTGLAEGRFPVRHDGLEEERRLFHVALTRAREQLYLSWPRASETRDGGMVAHEPSIFLQELGWLPGGPEMGRTYDAWVISERARE